MAISIIDRPVSWTKLYVNSTTKVRSLLSIQRLCEKLSTSRLQDANTSIPRPEFSQEEGLDAYFRQADDCEEKH